MKQTTYEIIARNDIALWLSGPLPGRDLDSEFRYLRGVYGTTATLSYLPTPTARRMAKDGKLRDFRATGR